MAIASTDGLPAFDPGAAARILGHLDSHKNFAAAPIASARPSIALSEQGKLAIATEELTFHFSAVVEAQHKQLEQRLSYVEDGMAEFSVERVRKVLQLMEGPGAHTTIRDDVDLMMRAFTQAAKEGRSEIPIANIPDPGKRYALMRLAHHELTARGAADAASLLAASLKTLYATQGECVRASLNIAVVASDHAPCDSARQQLLRDTYYGLLKAKPSAKTFFDKMLELGNNEGTGSAYQVVQRAFEADLRSAHSSIDKTLLLRAGVPIAQLGQICQSVIFFARELATRFGEVGVREDGMGVTAFAVRCAKELLLLADSMTPPRGLLERLSILFQGRDVEAKQAARFFNALYIQSLLWPPVIWSAPERKETVLQQIKKLLDKYSQG